MLSDSLVVQGPDKSGPQLFRYFLLGLQNGVNTFETEHCYFHHFQLFLFL